MTGERPSLINGFKAEVIDRRRPADHGRDMGGQFNNCRLPARIGNIPPAEAEDRYYAMMAHPRGGVTQTK